MMSTAETLQRGMDCLRDSLGVVETERFISIILREQMDYTEWRRQYFDSIPDAELEADIENFVKSGAGAMG